MCGRYTLRETSAELVNRYLLDKTPDQLKLNYNVSPGQIMPVVIKDNGKKQLEFMKWGLVPFWAKDPMIGYKLINARDDGIFSKPAWRKPILTKRCLIPADGFYEWLKPADSKSKKQPYFIHPKNSQIFSFAGIWDDWHDAEGHEIRTYSIITTGPNKEMAKIHNRMPVILDKANENTWLTEALDKDIIAELLQPSPDNSLDMYRVSDDVNSPSNNDEHLIYALEE
jgi:putative SOS response-associated peptidase YedK